MVLHFTESVACVIVVKADVVPAIDDGSSTVAVLFAGHHHDTQVADMLLILMVSRLTISQFANTLEDNICQSSSQVVLACDTVVYAVLFSGLDTQVTFSLLTRLRTTSVR